MKITWRKWQPTPVFLPGEFHGQRSQAGYSPWGYRVWQDWTTDHAGLKCTSDAPKWDSPITASSLLKSNVQLWKRTIVLISFIVSKRKELYKLTLWTTVATILKYYSCLSKDNTSSKTPHMGGGGRAETASCLLEVKQKSFKNYLVNSLWFPLSVKNVFYCQCYLVWLKRIHHIYSGNRNQWSVKALS